MKIPDNTGRIKLIEKAQNNSEMNALSSQKKLQEEVICNLVKDFKDFDQITFSELDTYILVSNFSQDKIVEAFKDFVFQKDINEDLILKGTVTRSIQHLQRTAFTYSYITERFKNLQDLDPWLYVELVIACNWQKGIEVVIEQLKKNYDSSYLFSMLPEWMNIENNKDDISEALSKWYPLFNDQDKKLADYYAENYGYKIKNTSAVSAEINSVVIQTLIANEGFVAFIQNGMKPNYKTLTTC